MLYNQAMQKSIPEHTACQVEADDGLHQQKTTPGATSVCNKQEAEVKFHINTQT